MISDNLQKHYDALWESSNGKISSGNINLDLQLDDPNDNRFGITLLARPDVNSIEKIQNLCTSLSEIEPKQYFYPSSDVHITILSIISCYDGFNMDQIDVESYIETIGTVLAGQLKFEIKLQGVTASDSAIMIQGFPKGNVLENLRNDIRKAFKSTNLEHSIDSRYKLQTAHATVVRFRKSIDDKPRFLHKLQEYRHSFFGEMTVDKVELVYNDWYQRTAKVKLLKLYQLGA